MRPVRSGTFLNTTSIRHFEIPGMCAGFVSRKEMPLAKTSTKSDTTPSPLALNGQSTVVVMISCSVEAPNILHSFWSYGMGFGVVDLVSVVSQHTPHFESESNFVLPCQIELSS